MKQMRMAWRTWALSGLLAWALAAAAEPAGGVFQVSTIHALMEGVYDGQLTLGELKRQGDFGIGTFNRVDGELVLDRGQVYQVLHSGAVKQPPDSLQTPFAVVHHFGADLTLPIDEEIGSLEALKQWLDRRLPSLNAIYGVRIRGRLDYVKTRSVPAAEQPYPPLVDIVKRQNNFEREGVAGVLVGYRLPDYLGQVNVPGYHLHFLADDRDFGGHLLDCRLRDLKVEVDVLTSLQLQLLDTPEFMGADLSRFSRRDLDRVEIGPAAGADEAARRY
jgi:acetolactate decarboxylase